MLPSADIPRGSAPGTVPASPYLLPTRYPGTRVRKARQFLHDHLYVPIVLHGTRTISTRTDADSGHQLIMQCPDVQTALSSFPDGFRGGVSVPRRQPGGSGFRVGGGAGLIRPFAAPITGQSVTRLLSSPRASGIPAAAVPRRAEAIPAR